MRIKIAFDGIVVEVDGGETGKPGSLTPQAVRSNVLDMLDLIEKRRTDSALNRTDAGHNEGSG